MLAYTIYESDSRVRRMSEALVDAGSYVECLSLKQSSKPFKRNIQNVKVLNLPVHKYQGDNKAAYIISHLYFFLITLFVITWKTIRKPYDVIHVHNMPDFLVFSAIIARLRGTKVILDLHDLVPEATIAKWRISEDSSIVKILKLQEKISTGFADTVLCVSQPEMDVIVKRGIAKRKVHVIMNLPDEKIFYPRTSERDDHSFLIVYHGTIAERLGLDIAVEAVNLVKDKIPNIFFNIYGDGDYVDYLNSLISDKKLQKWIRCHGERLPVDEIPILISTADIGIVPNYDWNDRAGDSMLPVKLLEYVAMGIPVICSRLKTVEYYFDDEMLKFINPGDSEDLAKCIIQLHKEPEQRKLQVTKANKFLTSFNWLAQKKYYNNLIENLSEGIS